MPPEPATQAALAAEGRPLKASHLASEYLIRQSLDVSGRNGQAVRIECVRIASRELAHEPQIRGQVMHARDRGIDLVGRGGAVRTAY